MEVDRNRSLALKYQVYEALKQEFSTNYKPGMMTPTEVSLTKHYGVGLGTVRYALERFRDEGIIIRHSGRGSFLSEDFLVKLKRYSVGIILSSAEFTDMKEWECSWIQNMEIINGMMDKALKRNIKYELIPEENVSEAYCSGFDGFIIWGPVSEEIRRVLKTPYFKMRYDIDLENGFTALGLELLKKQEGIIAFIGGEKQLESRLSIVNAILKKAGHASVNHKLIRVCGGSESEGYKACRSLLEGGIPFNTLLCSTDLRAIGALKALRMENIEVPERIEVYGFDGLEKTKLCEPPLTTVSYDWNYPGEFAMEAIRALLDGTPPPKYEQPKGTLIKRRSTKE